MKAWVLEEFNGPQSMELKTQTVVSLKENEVRVKILACGINNKDIYISKGMYYRSIEAPTILGSDIAGIVIEMGSKAKVFQINDRIIVSPIIGCGNCTYCLKEQENKCSYYYSILGGFAEEIVIPENNLIKIPDFLTFIEAAALPISYMTAWNMLYNRANVKESETVLFWGASSGVGTGGILLMKNKKNIIAVAGGEEKVVSLKKLGIERVIDYKSENVYEKVLSYTDGEGVDVVFDPVGKVAWDTSLKLLKNNGKHVNCARNTGSIVDIDLGILFSKQITIYGAKSGTKIDLKNIISHLLETKQKPIISKVFPFEDAKEALDFMENGVHFGKVILSSIYEGGKKSV